MNGRARRRHEPPERSNTALPAQTIVSFHAHPDDEALLTGGTLALLSAAGHRVVLVTATAGGAGLSDTAGGAGLGDGRSSEPLGLRRSQELVLSAAALGVARVVQLDYPDSGWDDSGRDVAGPAESGRDGSGATNVTPRITAADRHRPFSVVPVAEAASALADILVEEHADVLTVYDANGGYGHPDHVRVHDVGIAAAAIARTPRVLEATLDRTLMSRAVRALALLHLVPAGTPVQRVPVWYSGREQITHRIDVRRFTGTKRRALACHVSQSRGGTGPRTVTILLKLPRPLFRLVCGTEWFVETGAAVPPTPLRALLTPAAARVGVER